MFPLSIFVPLCMILLLPSLGFPKLVIPIGRPLNPTQKGLIMRDFYQGSGFLSRWDFFSWPDPTHGTVNYLTKDKAVKQGLVKVQGNTFIMRVDNTTWLPQGQGRNSIRISTKTTYDTGLFIADIQHAPYGCSVWPAWWSVGPNWPQGGEIDVIEGVHNSGTNQYTLHTSPGCQLDAYQNMTGTVLRTDCTSSGYSNLGCAVLDSSAQTFGQPFNQGGGGVFAHQVDENGISIWRFPRNNIPIDIINRSPQPWNWGPPVAYYASDSCDTASHFYDHVLVFNIALCGDWAGATYKSAGCPGTCNQAVANPKNFNNAYWAVNYVAVYDV